MESMSSRGWRQTAAAFGCACIIVLALPWAPPVEAAAAAWPAIDIHVHLVNFSDPALSYTWASVPANAPIARTWTIADYATATRASPVRPSAFVFCEVAASPASWGAEARYVQALADAQPPDSRQPRLSAIVAHVALQDAQVGATLDALQRDVPLLRGVRQGDVGDEGAPGFLTQPGFGDGLEELARRGLHYELLLNSELWADAVQVVRAHPNVTFVVNHLADPGIVPQGRDPAGWAAWTNNMTQLAARPNVFLMVDGAPEAASHSAAKYGNWTEAEIRRYVEFGIRTFGFDRCMFAGNWFWLNLFGTYEQWTAALLDILQDMGATEAEMNNLFSATASRVYRIDGVQ